MKAFSFPDLGVYPGRLCQFPKGGPKPKIAFVFLRARTAAHRCEHRQAAGAIKPESDLAPSDVRGRINNSDELDRRDSQNGENKKVAIFERIIIDKTIQPVLEEKVGAE